MWQKKNPTTLFKNAEALCRTTQTGKYRQANEPPNSRPSSSPSPAEHSAAPRTSLPTRHSMGLWASKHADYLPVPWCAIERAALKLMPLVSSCWPTTSGQSWRFSQGQHAGSCLSLAKMQSQWWWLCWKIASGSWEVALSNAVILCSLYLL